MITLTLLLTLQPCAIHAHHRMPCEQSFRIVTAFCLEGADGLRPFSVLTLVFLLRFLSLDLCKDYHRAPWTAQSSFYHRESWTAQSSFNVKRQNQYFVRRLLRSSHYSIVRGLVAGLHPFTGLAFSFFLSLLVFIHCIDEKTIYQTSCTVQLSWSPSSSIP